MIRVNYETLLDQLFGEDRVTTSFATSGSTLSTNSTFNKFSNYHAEQTDDSYVLELAVPGLTKSDISAKIVDGKLKVEGGVKDHKWTPEFKRSFILPKNVDAKNVKATVENGIFTVTIGISKENETVVKIS